ncbi:MAG: HD domain-containing protein [Campylobacterota bacterium]|nr:HD domain-containing protein [Campylobacterota bacterium]
MKKLLYTLVLIVISTVIHQIYYNNQISILKKEVYLQKSLSLKSSFQKLVDKKQNKTAAMTYIISQDKNLQEALFNKDIKLLNYEKTIKGIEKFVKYKDLWLQIIDKDGYSFYRSWTNKIGDHAATARVDIAKMLIDQKAVYHISTGRFDMTFKTMQPIYKDGEFLGIVELISHFNSIHNDLKSKDIEPIMIVDKSYTPKFIKPYSGLFIGENYVTNVDASKSLMREIENIGIDKFLNIKDYILHKDYLVTTFKINNILNKPMGYFVLFAKQNNIEMNLIQEFKITHYKRVMVFLILSALLILLIINRKYVKNLNIDVLKKTKEISKQKDDLNSLLNIYDKNVIFSSTDTKGIITDVSEAFCKISGYTKEELIGKNHNIIRHPDMTKEAFKYLWDELEKGNKVNLEVKNLKKDNTFYWVDAEFEPEYKNGKIIGYSAVREDITSKKEINEIQKDIIFAMGSIGETRSKETGNHVKRVALYSKILALSLGLDKLEAEMLMQASPMHDIGKVAIGDEILKKPLSLTKDEWDIMKTHSLKGYEMLKHSNRPLLKMAATIAYEHHEKYDGSGYPRGLKGKEIHIYGRITAVADVFDALGSNRVYKKAWSDEKIFDLFKEEKGKHFDPEIIDIFFDNLDSFLKVRDTFKDTI